MYEHETAEMLLFLLKQVNISAVAAEMQQQQQG